ncbi:hypothetical protein E8E12_000992 [Didymella heteroderae]|uniref:Uncharacterized protein n=1 Tax=Didymella heteroderae TaxID=1769908 RepID=A0A9P5BUK6_9PLEO|nr:hypothetical protein E8E12_000992 [Didymella heteroderae]
MTWEQFCNLTARLVSVADDQVSGRYAYGEVRLSRLNFYAPLFLRKWHFHRVEYQYKEYFAVFYAPILFAAGVASILLSGFRVAVAVAVQETGVAVNSAALLHVALWSSVVIMLFFCAVGLTILGLFVYKRAIEWMDFEWADATRGVEPTKLNEVALQYASLIAKMRQIEEALVNALLEMLDESNNGFWGMSSFPRGGPSGL